ncbi:acylphosphatase-2 isoform X3 [Bubalus kerabau]|uniref:acylphosphatase-2 isoform X3 n=1 Tax=Bubalus carabanensis TaxID=3119969 RepID=UPI00244EEC81|nr:acylphosphatase-2 isoform X3 [Bubalus carabanensis]
MALGQFPFIWEANFAPPCHPCLPPPACSAFPCVQHGPSLAETSFPAMVTKACPTTVTSLTFPRSISLESTAALALELLHTPQTPAPSHCAFQGTLVPVQDLNHSYQGQEQHIKSTSFQGTDDWNTPRKSWLSKVGSPSSRIDRTNFSNEKTISKLEYSSFNIRY